MKAVDVVDKVEAQWSTLSCIGCLDDVDEDGARKERATWARGKELTLGFHKFRLSYHERVID